MLYLDLMNAEVNGSWVLGVFRRRMPLLKCSGMWRLEGLVMGDEDDAPVFFFLLIARLRRKESVLISQHETQLCQCSLFLCSRDYGVSPIDSSI